MNYESKGPPSLQYFSKILMYCIYSDDSEYWLYRLMRDEKYQGKGYSKMAMNLLLETIKLDKIRHKVYLGVDRDGSASVKFHESCEAFFIYLQ